MDVNIRSVRRPFSINISGVNDGTLQDKLHRIPRAELSINFFLCFVAAARGRGEEALIH